MPKRKYSEKDKMSHNTHCSEWRHSIKEKVEIYKDPNQSYQLPPLKTLNGSLSPRLKMRLNLDSNKNQN